MTFLSKPSPQSHSYSLFIPLRCLYFFPAEHILISEIILYTSLFHWKISSVRTGTLSLLLIPSSYDTAYHTVCSPSIPAGWMTSPASEYNYSHELFRIPVIVKENAYEKLRMPECTECREGENKCLKMWWYKRKRIGRAPRDPYIVPDHTVSERLSVLPWSVYLKDLWQEFIFTWGYSNSEDEKWWGSTCSSAAKGNQKSRPSRVSRPVSWIIEFPQSPLQLWSNPDPTLVSKNGSQ